MDMWVKGRHKCVVSGHCNFEDNKINLPKNEVNFNLLTNFSQFFIKVYFTKIVTF